MTNNNTPMIGRRAHTGPGGRGCNCCNEAPGKPRKVQRRALKGAERTAWRREVREARY